MGDLGMEWEAWSLGKATNCRCFEFLVPGRIDIS